MPLIDPDRPEAVPARASSRGRMPSVAAGSVSLLTLALLLLAGPAEANGGRGGNPEGNSNTGGLGGTDSATGAGGAGSNGFQQYAGGGGGGAGATAGGGGGLTWSHDPTLGRGGTGGVHGSVGAGLPVGNSTGSNGGNGADGSTASGGGGGGAGGWGAVVTGAGTTGVVSGTITGGNGGAGGNTYWDFGGSGGSGGTGLSFTNSSQTTTLTVNGTIQGGNGGGRGINNPGTSGGPGAYGAGGIGIVGANLSITNNGTIAGGLSGDGVTRTWAIRFTSGNNTLTFGNATSGLIGGILMDAGTLTFAQPTDVTLDNVINGNGSVIKTGAGTLMLTGANTYTGGTTISGGKLSVSSDTNLGNASGGLTLDGGTLLVTSSFTSARTVALTAAGGGVEVASSAMLTLSGDIGGSGGLTKSGAGTLVLTGANTYAGGTTISSGKLSVSSNGNLGDASGGLTLNGGTLLVTNSITSARTVTLSGSGGGIEVDAGRAVLWTGTITGTGGLTKSGGGTLALQNNSNYSGATLVEAGTLVGSSSTAFSANSNFTVSAGATLELSDVPGLVATVGSLAGAGAVQIGSGATLKAGSSNASTTFSGTISGNGALDKTGTGTLTLTGSNTYTGGTKVSGGKLVVNGSITGSVTLSGGTLGGSGTVGTLAVASGGTVAPGNSIGTLKVSGNISFASGSVYQVEVNAAGEGDKIVVTGSASITGGTVAVLAASGNYAASTSYTILTANGGVSGQFSGVTSNLAFLTPSLSYDSRNVTLTMTRNETGFGPGGGNTGGDTSGGSGGTSGNYVAATRNQGFIANAAERLGVGNPIYDTLLSATVDEARAGFDLLSGEAHAQAVGVMIEESRLVRDTILGRLRGPLLTQAGQQVAASFSADLPGRKSAVVMNAPVPQPRYALWGEAFGGTGNTDADGNAASLSRRTGGALLGAEFMVYDAPGSSLKLGVAGGYSQSRFDLDARLSSGKVESGHAALYAGARFGSLRFDAGAAYSWSESDIRRQVQIRGFGDLLRLQRPGSVMQGFAELGYGFAFSGFALEPFAQLALIRASTDAGTEQGGAAALRVLSSEQTLGFSTLGVRAEAQLGSAPLFARAMLGWRHGFGELTPQARTAFATGTTPSVVFASRIDREALVAEAGLDWRISSSTALGLTYSAAIGERSRDHALKGRVEMRF